MEALIAAANPNDPMVTEYERKRQHYLNEMKYVLETGKESSTADMLRNIAQGPTFNFADEIEAGIRAPFSDQSYGEIRDDIRGGLGQYRAIHPEEATAGTVAGALVPAAGMATVGQKVFQGVSSLPQLLGRGAALGAAIGGVAGYGGGEGEGVIEQVVDTAKGAVVGGALFPATMLLPAVGKGLTKVWQGFSKSAATKADDIVADLVAQTGWSADEVVDQLNRLGPEATLADIQVEVAKILGSTRGRSVGAGRIIDDAYGPRQAGAKERLTGAIEEASGVSVGTESLVNTMKQLRAKYASPYYNEGLGQPVIVDEQLEFLLQHPAFKSSANKILQFSGRTADNVKAGDTLSAQVFDDIKKTIDRKVSGLTEDNLGRSVPVTQVPEAGYLQRGNKAMTANVDRQVPVYQQGREVSARYANMLENIKKGRDASSTADPQKAFDLAESMTDKSPVESRLFKAGAVGDVKNRIAKSGGAQETGFAGSQLGDPLTRSRRLSLVTGGDERVADKLERMFQGEAQFHRTYSLTNPEIGSKTSAMAQGDELADQTASILTGALDPSGASGFSHILDSLRGVFGMSPRVAEEVAKRLTTKNLSREYVERLLADGQLPEPALDVIERWLVRTTTPATGAAIIGGQ
jgi:hypothetical protein